MNGKFRKIGLAVSGMLCAVMLFTCALPVKAAVNACDHMSRLYLGEFKIVEKDHYDSAGHYYTKETRASCEKCGTILVLRSETGYESHYIYTLINKQTCIATDFCDECNYKVTYPVIVVD